MTSYIAITDAETDPSAPITSELAKKWRDNPIAIAEGDATVPDNLRSTVLLGTLTMTSGTSQTLSGLVLTPYKNLFIEVDRVSHNGTSTSMRLEGFTATTASQSSFTIGRIFVNLSTGNFVSFSEDGNTWSITVTPAISYIGDCGLSTASTSLTFSISNGTFDAGSILVYGVK